MKKWKCTVCGYIHQGAEPPDICPICGATKDKFVEIIDEPAPQSVPAAPDDEPSALEKQILKHHLHPMSVHVPNGVIPVSFAFVALAAVFNSVGLADAAFYNLIFVALTMPVVWVSGYIEWKRKYAKSPTGKFIVKISAATTVTICAMLLIVWHVVAPDITTMSTLTRALFLAVHLVMLAAAGTAGFIGGKLVFKE